MNLPVVFTDKQSERFVINPGGFHRQANRRRIFTGMAGQPAHAGFKSGGFVFEGFSGDDLMRLTAQIVALQARTEVIFGHIGTETVNHNNSK